jgi:2'-5' RNA ligase
MGEATTRLFLALWPDEGVRDALAARRDAWAWPAGASPVADGKLHLTLHFLGSQPSERLPELLDGFAVPVAPFCVELGKPILWPHGIAVLEPLNIPPELIQLHDALTEALVRLGMAPEPRQYRPHVTMARRATRTPVPPPSETLAWRLDSYALVESRGGAYTVLRTYR